MAVYTDITDAELQTLLASYAIGRATGLTGIREGIENSNFILDTETGRYILTVFERRAREAELPYFMDLTRWLSERGFPCPQPIAGRAGQVLSRVRGKPCAIVSFLDGRPIEPPDVEACREAGKALARLHRAGEGFPDTRTNDLSLSAWRSLFEPRRAEAEALEPALEARIAADLDALEAVWPSDLPRGPIHADLFPDNVFFRDGRFSGAIDFYFACDDALAYDLAICLNAWCFDAAHRFQPDHAQALIQGYEAVRPLASAERDALPILVRGAAMRFFLTRLVDWARGADGALVTPKNPIDYAIRLDFHRTDGLKAVL